MTLGNVVALVQTNVKRMLAYSSIAHTGYILAAVAAYRAGDSASAAVLFYVIAYGLMSGTSADGIDAALVILEGSGPGTGVELLAFRTYPFSPEVRDRIRTLESELNRAPES
jgi:NADH-quinone oxidoreductase subunit N